MSEHSLKRRHTYNFVSEAGLAMSSLHFPEGPYENAGLALHRERGRKLTRAESFHPNEEISLKGLNGTIYL